MVYFFNRFYFRISRRSLFAVTMLVYIQDIVGRGWGNGISARTMIIVVMVLLCENDSVSVQETTREPSNYYMESGIIKNLNLTDPANPEHLNGYGNSTVPHTTKFRLHATCLGLRKAASEDLRRCQDL